MSDQVGCPYQVLQVSRDANDDEIKKAYRKLAVIHHPDKNQGSVEATQMFQKIGSAYALLSDPDRRSRYDMTGSLNEDDDEEGPDMDDLMQMFFQSFGGGMMFGGAPMYFEMNGGRQRGSRKGNKARQAQQQEEMFANIFGGFESYDDSDEDDDGFFDDPAYCYMDESEESDDEIEGQLLEVIPALFCQSFMEEHAPADKPVRRKDRHPSYKCTLCEQVMRSTDAAEMHIVEKHEALMSYFVGTLEEADPEAEIMDLFEEFAEKVKSGEIKEKTKKKRRPRGPRVRRNRRN